MFFSLCLFLNYYLHPLTTLASGFGDDEVIEAVMLQTHDLQRYQTHRKCGSDERATHIHVLSFPKALK